MKTNIHHLNNVNPQYIKEIVDLWNENALETAECELDEQDKEMIRKQLNQYIQSTYGAVFIVMNEKRGTIGYGLASMKQDLVGNILTGQIDEVYMTPQYRRKKLGKQLVGELISWFHQQDVSSVHVYVDVENEPGLHFWEGIGLNRAFYILSKH